MAPQRPHLPPEFLTQLLAEPWMAGSPTIIFSPEFNAGRVQMVNQNAMKKDLDWKGELGIQCIPHGFEGGFFEAIDKAKLSLKLKPGSKAADAYPGYTFLHVAIDETDPPIVCELIRLGAPIDAPDGRGQMPLLQALQRARELHCFSKATRERPQALAKYEGVLQSTEPATRRLRFIATVLIQQHANVNATTLNSEGRVVSSLHLAYGLEDWDLVELLLNHGAKCKPTPTCIDVGDREERVFVSPGAKRRFAALKAKTQAAAIPPRLCPCFSGKPLRDCHSKKLPYPDEFACPCGSGKTSVKCCKTRSIDLTEMWDEKTKCIQSASPFGGTFSAVPAFLESQSLQEMSRDPDVLAAARAMADSPRFDAAIKECLAEACSLGIVDRGFAVTYLEIRALPWPQGRKSSKYQGRQFSKTWNEVVDKYIASGVDSRPRTEIEAAAKVGISLGALFRVCEADGCAKREGRDIEKVSVCGRCKMTFYCGAACQKSHWPVHKRVCGSENQTERPLPSQLAFSEFVLKWTQRLYSK
ncbi:hypothetical protein K438DRAFT_1859395 [Mycena galopus ATCC 62051]|nr:hypothetical protein K438DRAFT_1859395 [Mycena galopus ATCC 62051]